MLESIIDIVRRAGELIRSAHNVTAATHEKNGPADLVTEYDLAVQRITAVAVQLDDELRDRRQIGPRIRHGNGP